MLKQSLSQELPEEALILDGEYLQYTNLNELSFGVPQPANAAIEYQFELTDSDGIYGIVGLEIRNKSLPKDPARKGTAVNSFFWCTRDGKRTKINLRKGTYRCPRVLKKYLPKAPRGYKPVGETIVKFRHFLPENFIISAIKEKNNAIPPSR